MPTQLVEQGGEVRVRAEHHQQNRFWGQGTHDNCATGAVEDHQSRIAATGGAPKIARRKRERWHERREAFGVDEGAARTIDQEAVTAKHDDGVDALASPQNADEISDGGHGGTLEGLQGEVKRKPLPDKGVPTACRVSSWTITSVAAPLLHGRRFTSVIPMRYIRFARPGAPRIARRALAFWPLLVLAVVGACGDNNGLLAPASNENVARQVSLFAMTGTAPALPAAYVFTSESVVRPQVLGNGAPNFELAFDITADGRVLFMPVKWLVPAPPSGSPTVALLKATADFDALERAPDRGYVADSTLLVAKGETVLVRLSSSGCVYGDPYYAKMRVDTIIATERRIIFSSLVNRNCGYRALTAGVPKN